MARRAPVRPRFPCVRDAPSGPVFARLEGSRPRPATTLPGKAKNDSVSLKSPEIASHPLGCRFVRPEAASRTLGTFASHSALVASEWPRP